MTQELKRVQAEAETLRTADVANPRYEFEKMRPSEIRDTLEDRGLNVPEGNLNSSAWRVSAIDTLVTDTPGTDTTPRV